MTAGEWISLGSSIGALCAAVVALFTLLELSKQRKSAYKPDLCVLKNQYDIKPGTLGKVGGIPFALDWVPQGLPQSNKHFWATIRIVNVGFGAAKNINTKWKFDSNLLLNEVNQMAQRTFQTFFLTEDDFFICVKSNGKNNYRVNNKFDSFQFEYLLPIGNQPTGHDIFLPPAYTLLVAAYLFLCLIEEKSITEMRIPTIELDLSYEDIGNERHDTHHKLQGNISSITHPSNKEDKSPPEFGLEFIEIA